MHYCRQFPARTPYECQDSLKAADLAPRGMQVRRADYDRHDTLSAAFKAIWMALRMICAG
jgi:hypothetical protein